jgi:subtilisin family serine protease
MKYEKLSAGLLALAEDYQTQGTAGVLAQARSVPLAAAPAGVAPCLRVFMRCRADATFFHLPAVRVHEARGEVRTAQVPLDHLDPLSEDPQVSRLAPAVVLRPLMDVAAHKVGLNTLRSAHPSLTGRGVVIGIVDSGIDTTHPAFAGRVLSIWDQTIAGTGWGTTQYGTVLSGARLGMSLDTAGHGTHVAGIAAGHDAVYGGVAAEAGLIIVKTDFMTTSIGDGVRYVFAEAARLGLPAVVNLSLGGHADAHDGSDDLSAVLDQESGPGRIVVAAAGNEGTDPIRREAILATCDAADLPFQVAPNSTGNSPPWVVLNGWYEGAGGCEVSIRTSSGDVTAWQPVITAGSPTQNYSFANARIQVSTPPATVNPNEDHQFWIELRPGAFSEVVQGGTWQLRLRNTGTAPVRVNVWSIVPPGSAEAAFLSPSPGLRIGSPGAAASAVTVAAYTTRNHWQDAAGATRAVGLGLDDIADFSSPGPLRNGANKPDVTAPGAMIISCLSAASHPPASNIVTAGFRVNAGTSMASPFIAGLVALLLQRAPHLDPAAVKALLQSHSAIPAQPPGTFDAHWGYGLINAGEL